MNEVVWISMNSINVMNKMKTFLLAGDKIMPEMHLRQPGLTYSAFRPVTKNKNEHEILKKQEICRIFIKTN